MPQALAHATRSSRRTPDQCDFHRGVWPILQMLLLLGARATLLAVLSFAPWHYGGVEPDIQTWLNSMILGSLCCWVGSSLLAVGRGEALPQRIPSLFVPLLGGLVLGAVQLLPPVFTSSHDSRGITAHHDSLVDAVGKPSARALLQDPKRSGSVYPAATRLEIARLGMAIVACFLGVVLFSNSSSQVWLWGSFAVNGAALAFFGIVQQLSWNGKLFWTVPLLLGGQPFASFVNRNNAAGYLNLCLAAAWGLSIWSLQRNSRKPQHSAIAATLSSSQSQSSRVRDGHSRAPILNGMTLTCMLLAVLIVAGIVCSASRGGVLAMIVAGGVVSLLAGRSRSRGGLVAVGTFVAIVALSMGLVFWTGQENRFLLRWGGTVGDSLASGANTRFANWHDALQSTREFPLTGTGLGTYSFAYIPFQSWDFHSRFYNADNQFVECLVEGGGIGLLLVLSSLGIWLATSLVLIRFRPGFPVGMVGLFAVVGQSISWFFDFGPTIFSNMVGLAVLAGAITGSLARLDETVLQSASIRWLLFPELRPRIMMIVVGMSLGAYGLSGLRDLSAAADCRTAWRSLPRQLDLSDSLDAKELEAAIQKLTEALERRPDDADAHASLARLWIFSYRAQAYEELTEFKRRGGPAPRWALTDPIVLFDRIHEWKRSKETSRIESVRKAIAVQKNLVPAYKHLKAARTACPLMPGLDLSIAILSAAVSPNCEPDIEAALRRAITLSPSSPEVANQCRALAESAGLNDLARECHEHRLTLSAGH